uniref:G protein-coupled receptor n=1 Tax=Caenorhabditis japonica TaxID=281687 RepID=A0A8R1I075_CAEJA
MMCVWRNSSLELETFAPSILHPLAVVEVSVHLLAAYVIVRKTPSRMASVKWTMLAMHVLGAYLDLFLSALSTQYFLIPTASGYSSGVYTDLLGISVKWQAYMFISAICLSGVSILGFFENRYNALVKGSNSRLTDDKRRMIYVGAHYVYAFTFILPITFTPPEQEFGKAYVREMLPCIPQSVLDHPHFFVYAIDITLLTYLIAMAAVVIAVETIFFFIRIVIYLSSQRARSQKTYKLQLQFFIALSVQIVIPILVLLVPIGYIVFAFSQDYFDQGERDIILIKPPSFSCSTQQHLAKHDGVSRSHLKPGDVSGSQTISKSNAKDVA